ncbi:hypothetical protein CBFG_00869 [Clostridiales bacterium 1_7_47FAA]|nr:hypothetical protein CBFG_00869 [Clostridiales bacterium 1_7_47FAA]
MFFHIFIYEMPGGPGNMGRTGISAFIGRKFCRFVLTHEKFPSIIIISNKGIIKEINKNN